MRGMARILMFLIPVALVAGGWMYLRSMQEQTPGNYTLEWSAPAGWKEARMSPMALFRYKHPKEETYIRCSLNQNVGDLPSLHRTPDSLADFQLETTEQNQKGWTGKRLTDIQTDILEFALLRREQPSQVVVTAFGIKDNTTIMVSLTAAGKKASQQVEAAMPELEKLLKGLQLKRIQLED
jgi:hypothetical protein